MVDEIPGFVVRCEGLDREVQGAPGETLFQALRSEGVPVASACRGDGICGRCGLLILEGSLPPPDAEERGSLLRNHVAAGLRLSCLVRPQGRLRVKALYW